MSPNVAYADGEPQSLWQDGERTFRRGWCVDVEGKRRAVLLVTPAVDHPSRASLDRLTHEYELKDELDREWAVRPLDLIRDAGRSTLVLEYEGGEPVDRLLGVPMEIGRFLRLAAAISFALGRLHQRGIVHKDIKPANILLNDATGEVRLTGFGIASRVARERQSPHPPETIAGTLAYMAPEQTGRMNRSIDSRSDLYALGVTFYQMLTGVLPYTATEPMEWVHCHLARRPVPPAERLKEIPGAISAIIMKLLAKRAEDRYQTVAGLISDLRSCEDELEAQGRIDDFPLGERDTPDRLLIPEKLYGRRREVDILLTAFDRVVNGGAPELVLVSGYSGVGKSSVVNELQPVLVPPRGLFASGKFDQLKRNIPYATLAQAFQSLVRPLLGKSEADLAPWRDALRETLGSNAGLMVDLVPELKVLIGEPPLVPELPPQDAQRRFQMVLRQLIGVFARPEHPLALFLDDLQWLDAATLDLLEDLLSRSDLRNLLLIGAYRDNEVTAAHPLMRELEAIRATGRVQDIKLAPLTSNDLRNLIADMLRCGLGQADTLAGLVHAKTDGNPFFVVQFLHLLADERLVAFDHERARWSWDMGGIHAKRYTDNVVELLAGKLTRLPLDSQGALRQFACLGNVADVAMLSVVLEMSEEEVHAALFEARRQQLIDRLDRSYKFVHDRIQEAAYALIPEASRAEAHLTIGRLLVAQTPPEKRAEAVFEIVNQLNRGAPLITSREERERLSELNLSAGKRAKASSAYASALTYLTTGDALLPEDGWERRHDLAFELQLHAADCELCIGALQATEQRLAALAPRAVGTVQRCAVAHRRVDLYAMLGAGDRAAAVALECLRHVGIDWSAHPTELEVRREYESIWSQLGNRSIEDLVNLPQMQEPEVLATLNVLTSLGLPSLYTDHNLHALCTCRATNLNLEHGNSDAAPANYATMGVIASGWFGHYDEGYRFGKMGCDLLERGGWNHFGGKTYYLFGTQIPWTRPLVEGIVPLRRSFQMAKDHGDPTFAVFALRDLTSILLALGHPLDQVEREIEHGLEFVQRFGSFLDRLSAPLALVRTLRGTTTKFGLLDNGPFTERFFEERATDHPARAFLECYYWIGKLQARFLAGDYASAIDAALKVERWYAISASMTPFILQKTEYQFYAALSRAAWCEPMGPDPYVKHREALGRYKRELQARAANCPQNFEHRAALVGAEIARLEGRPLEAMDLYERAIASAHANGFVPNEALACELAARFYAARGFDQIAHLYLRNARQGYLRWGADGKVRQLDQLHPWLSQGQRALGSTGTIEAPVEYLDLKTIIELSQALSGEMVLERLINRLLRAAIEHAGAERGLLIVPQGDTLQIQAEAFASGEHVTVHMGEGSNNAASFPESLVRRGTRTHERLILDDASSQNAFSADPYVLRSRARSILCLPLICQDKLIGILYLENNQAPNVFTPDRVTLLEVLASQAAISLENSRLYHDLADREGKIRRLVDANIIGIIVADTEGRISEANDAFLHILGFDRDDFVSGNVRWNELTPPEWRDRTARALEELLTTGVAQPFEKEYFRKDGSRVPVLIGYTAFDEERDKGIAFVLDLTERKRAEKALRDSEERFRDFAEAASDWLWEMGPDHKLTMLTPNAFGSSPSARLGTAAWERALDLETEPEKWRAIQAKMDSHEPFRDFVYLAAGFDGSPMYVRANGKPVFGVDGEFLGYRGVGTDATEIIRAQEALRESELRLRSAIDGIPGLVGVLAPNGEVEAVNRQILEYCGQSLQELRNWGTNGTVHPEDLPHVAEVFTKSIASGIPYRIEQRLRRFDGEYRWFDNRGIPVRDDAGRIVRWYVLLTDIEDRNQALARLQQMQADFARMNRVSVMGELAASLSHEITQPIASARNNARAAQNFMKMQPPDLNEVSEALACVVGDTDRARDIIDRIRDHIKKAPPRKERFDLNAAINEVIVLARSLINRHGVSAQTRLSDGLGPVLGDRVQLQQVLLNLVLNAAEAMGSVEEGARDLLISTGRDRVGVRVSVRDTGPGIESTHLDRVFDAFYTTKSSGTGMGLSICRSIIDAHGGKLWAEANEPRGAVFHFTLPGAEAEFTSLPSPRN
ncbi:AAA family ATPase [Bradyrhizobium sp. CB1650]|uniref:ATP-binding sensor histidine kinase n=1 Tax=Bradyrhizobium sp. CB1650 TaxID=3039153 RepID=UPI002434B067|nr:AAA family ATPase [Bradyrhizobium sp. CB1650]WGD53154.1 AAA family ATPase [Bradyrhizobium sp. CB1650]